ncbi:MAG: hypothetical protein IJ215_00460 [Clostridia bacterium]|nr:hypothetical protein [Clostridia bacterium]
MKKQSIIAIAIIIVLVMIVTVALLLSQNGKKITDENKITDLKEAASLDIMVNLGEFSQSHYEDSKLLDVSMQLAEKLGMMSTYSDEEVFIEYVSREDLHSLIQEFTGLIIEAPIEVEDFYYLYDSENDYYYYRPATPSYYSINVISSVKENGNQYHITCSASKTEDTEVLDVLPEVKISLTYMPKNEYMKYQVNKISY